MNKLPTLKDIRTVADKIEPFIHRTPVMTSSSINSQLNAELFLNVKIYKK